MRRPTPSDLALVLASLLAAAAPLAQQAFPPVGSIVPPARRVETYLEAGVVALESLPEGTRLVVERASGMTLALEHDGTSFKAALPPPSLADEGRVLVTPLGFRLFISEVRPDSLEIAAPGGRWTRFAPRGVRVAVHESDGGRWDVGFRRLGLRLQDGTRVDLLEGFDEWEVLGLGGERFKLRRGVAGWQELAPLPSPPLVPDESVAYVAGDGDDWRFPVGEDHAVFGWNWYPYGLSVEQIVEPLRIGQRSLDIIDTFKGFSTMPPLEELAGYMIGRRLALSGGDRVTIDAPGRESVTAYLLPGHFDPDFYLPRLKSPDAFRRGVVSPKGR